MRYLAIDLGDARTGLALGDAVTRIATPLRVIECPIDREGGASLERELARAATEHLGIGTSGALVLGLPLNMDGTEGPRAALVRGWAERLTRVTGRAVHLWDERLSSAAADERMARTGLTRGQKKARRDALAAAAILESFLASLGHDPSARADDGR